MEAIPKSARYAKIRVILQSDELEAIHSCRKTRGMARLNEVVRALIGEALENQRDPIGKTSAG